MSLTHARLLRPFDADRLLVVRLWTESAGAQLFGDRSRLRRSLFELLEVAPLVDALLEAVERSLRSVVQPELAGLVLREEGALLEVSLLLLGLLLLPLELSLAVLGKRCFVESVCVEQRGLVDESAELFVDDLLRRIF